MTTKTYRMSTRQRELEQAWVCENGEDYREYLCQSCAEEFIEDLGITERNGTYAHYFGAHEDNDEVCYYSVPSWDEPELDYPMACNGYRWKSHNHTVVWLAHRLTREGEEYTREHFGPSIQRLYGMDPK